MQDYNSKKKFGDEIEVSVTNEVRNEPVYDQYNEGNPYDDVSNKAVPANSSVGMSKSEKKLAAAKKKKNKKGGRASLVILEVLCILLFCTTMWVMGTGRIEAADKLVGSTVLPEIITDAVVEDDPVENLPIDILFPDENKGEHHYVAEGYRYIVPANLEAKTATALAAWYLAEFDHDEGEPVNTEALAEFNAWFEKTKASDEKFVKNYQQAITHLEKHPELIESEKDKTATK